VHDILAALTESIKTNKKGVSGDLPLVVGFAFVVKVGVLELRTNIESKRKFLMSINGFLILDGFKNFWSINSASALFDDCIANLADKNYEACGCVVVLRVVPDQEDGMHDWNERLGDVVKFFGGV